MNTFTVTKLSTPFKAARLGAQFELSEEGKEQWVALVNEGEGLAHLLSAAPLLVEFLELNEKVQRAIVGGDGGNARQMLQDFANRVREQIYF